MEKPPRKWHPRAVFCFAFAKYILIAFYLKPKQLGGPACFFALQTGKQR
jgi:hypothetical protein